MANNKKTKANPKRKPTTDAVEILHRRYFKGKPEMMALLEEERANAQIARKIHDLRTRASLTQRQLAKLVGTTASVICRLEDADYEGHSLAVRQLAHGSVARTGCYHYQKPCATGRKGAGRTWQVPGCVAGGYGTSFVLCQ